jgi:hypothetical protein
MTATKLSPSAWWYASSALPVIAGIVIGVLMIVGAVKSVVHSVDDFTAPGQIVVRGVDDGDQRDIYVHRPSFISASGAACRVVGPNGPVALNEGDDTNLTINGDSYRSLLTFTANADGDYLVRCAPEQQVGLAVGPHIGVTTVASFIGGLGVIVLGFILAGLVAGLVAFLRHRSKVNQQRAQQYGGSAGPGGPTVGGLS